MNKPKLAVIIGARPQFIKHAAFEVVAKDEFQLITIHTGQHYDKNMSEVFFNQMNLEPPSYLLEANRGTHGVQTGNMMISIEEIILKEMPDAVMVYGDTNSTLAGALVASKLNIPIIHVESGLRSFNRSMPEEINRIITDHLSSLLFCSSEEGRRQLNKEGIVDNVYVTGDIMLDAFNRYYSFARQSIRLTELLPNTILENFYLLTIHRPANTADAKVLQQILTAAGSIEGYFVWPVHPRNQVTINKLNIPSNVHMFSPFSYFELLAVLGGAKKVITDSGGLQKEAYWAKRPCITVRPETEWKETLENNWNCLINISEVELKSAIELSVDLSTWKKLYGDGHSAEEIVIKIKEQFN